MSVAAAGENGTTYRCVITDGAGNVLISDSAKVVHVPILITSQPTDWWGTASERAAFTVQVSSTDANLTYQWQWLYGSTWIDSKATGVKTNSMSVAAAGENGTTYRCYITDSAGNVAISDSVTVHTDPLGFITQPEDCICSPSGRANFSVEVYGTDVTYQWQWHSPGSTTWANSNAVGAKTNAISLGVSGENGTVYRCVVTDAAGNVAYSDSATVIPYAVTWDYTYDANGLRTNRSSCAVSYDYIYNGSSLTQLTITEALDGSTTVMDIAYDASGTPMSVTYNGTNYYYATNLQGDVTAILNTSGTAVVQYTYDAWGRVLSTTGSMASTLGAHNPLRYRGYVYDQETQLYYLQSRYYDPAIGRFINADAYASTGQGILGNNMFAYCMNNPINLIDSMGYSAAAIALNPSAYEGFMLFLASIASSNYWNALGWAAAAILATGVITAGAIYLYELYLASNNNGGNTSNANSSSGGAASPQPPKNNKNKNNKDPNYRGGSTYNKDGVRIDYEYNGSTSETGNVHVHKKGFSYKYYYDIVQNAFIDESGALAPKTIQGLLQIKEIVRAINKAIAYIEG